MPKNNYMTGLIAIGVIGVLAYFLFTGKTKDATSQEAGYGYTPSSNGGLTNALPNISITIEAPTITVSDAGMGADITNASTSYSKTKPLVVNAAKMSAAQIQTEVTKIMNVVMPTPSYLNVSQQKIAEVSRSNTAAFISRSVKLASLSSGGK